MQWVTDITVFVLTYLSRKTHTDRKPELGLVQRHNTGVVTALHGLRSPFPQVPSPVLSRSTSQAPPQAMLGANRPRARSELTFRLESLCLVLLSGLHHHRGGLLVATLAPRRQALMPFSRLIWGSHPLYEGVRPKH